ncbi:hypothetical protein CFC21_050221 [Triticum aestivum]|uniref:NAD(P)H dehydrogenase (quinone) n=2 Tax=Triticum aestivum TaxID=4565 RepID=A0A3B6H2Z8_WHEAT|nr:hypothetical protein CFC21_050221 [Triticum aestivum]
MGSVTASTTAMPVLRVAAISGSVRSNSWHVGLIRAAEELCEESIPRLRIDHVDISSLPMANPDLETQGGDGFPPAVEAFRDRVAADCFLFASPEYNYSVTGSLKNTLDWGSTHLREIGIYLTCTSSTSRSSTSGRTRTRPNSTARGTSSTSKPGSGSCSSRCRHSRSGSNTSRTD